MSKKMAWFHVGLLLALLIVTPVVSWNFGTKPACIVFTIFFLSFCFWPIKR